MSLGLNRGGVNYQEARVVGHIEGYGLVGRGFNPGTYNLAKPSGALQAAKKSSWASRSVRARLVGHGFSPDNETTKSTQALAPEE